MKQQWNKIKQWCNEEITIYIGFISITSTKGNMLEISILISILVILLKINY